ncbi:AAA family ATPase [Loktanella sp. TSTF-M6]|uniref:AAA family ATPase n=1 Tax=Loktanella gaetbuli TaxID=2881335 RepID=A0ABS8BWX3_9RHOB|nr:MULTISPECIES: AAA family ATPase [Loktanella]MCB5200247.1 AAA family ATPase [Loktanella gaetbuli]
MTSGFNDVRVSDNKPLAMVKSKVPQRDPSDFNNTQQGRDSFKRMAQLDSAFQSAFLRAPNSDPLLLPTNYVWRDPALIPPRPWIYGSHLLRRQASVTVAPGGLGKSSLSIVEGLAMVTGRDLLGDNVHDGPKSVWLFNLEDPLDELERRIAAAMQLHGILGSELGTRLHIDSGRDRPLCTAIQTRNGAQIIEPVFEDLARQIRGRKIDVLVVDPFVSSHRVSENDNGAIDLVAKKWAKLADECNCAIELIHHTRKTNGEEATTEAARGASALLSVARSGRVLNRMTSYERESAGIPVDDLSTYFAVTRDKANLAPAGLRQWRHMASVHLANGDDVGVAEAWKWPDTFDGLTVKDLLSVQNAIDGKLPRYSHQAGGDWVGVIVADVLGLHAITDRKRIKKIIETWIQTGALVKVMCDDKKRMKRPCLKVGDWAAERSATPPYKHGGAK